MPRKYLWTGIGAVSGFGTFYVLFLTMFPDESSQYVLAALFSFVAAMPMVANGLIVGMAMDELEKRRMDTICRDLFELRTAQPGLASTEFEMEK